MTVLHQWSLQLQANCLAIHEFGKDLEAQVGKIQYLAVLVFSAYASGLLMVVTNRPVGAEAYLPVGASGTAPHAAALFFLATMVLPFDCPICFDDMLQPLYVDMDSAGFSI